MVDDDVREEWRSEYFWAIPELFELIKSHFRELHYLPIGQRRFIEDFDREEEPGHEPNAAKVQDIFQDHGLPNLAQYDQDKCIGAVVKVIEER